MAAIIGIAEVNLRIPWAHSLKDKRSTVKRIVERLKNGFNMSVSETDNQDKWQIATITMVTVGTSRRVVDARIGKAINLIERLYPGETINYHKEIL